MTLFRLKGSLAPIAIIVENRFLKGKLKIAAIDRVIILGNMFITKTQLLNFICIPDNSSYYYLNKFINNNLKIERFKLIAYSRIVILKYCTVVITENTINRSKGGVEVIEKEKYTIRLISTYM